jgi:hypothetical protein
MKHWKKGKVQCGYADEGITLMGSEGVNVVSLLINESGSVIIGEECDGCFFAEKSKEEAIELLEEGIRWIKNAGGVQHPKKS